MKESAKKTLMLRQVSAIFSIYLMVSLTFVTASAMATPVPATQISGGFSFSAFAIEFLNFLLPGVAAQDSCCVKTVSGDYCQSGTSSASCDVGYSSNKCSDLAVPECQIGTCVQQNGDCDASSTKQQCEDNSGFWTNQPLLAIPACTPTCCVYKSGAEIVDSQFVFFRNKCEKLPQAKDENLPFEEQDIGFKACQQIVPAETKGYCTVEANAACTYTTRADCDARQGDFSSKRCSSCQQNYEQKCFNGDEGYGVYNFDSCSGPGTLVNNCAISEICEDKDNVVQCVDKTCSVDVKFTNLGYDTAYIKSGQVEVITKNGKSMADAGSASFSLSQGDQACVNFQGPGEQHYAATCQLGELLVFGMDDSREKVCVFSGTKATARPNNYQACTDSGKSRAGLLSNGGVLSDVFDFLGGDFINPKWWDYYVINPGLSDRSTCESQGMCVEGPNNDCVPKYAPASVNLCGDCSTTEASSPWNKCGEVTQCTSRGYCQLTEAKMNPFAGATICTIQTITQKALIYGIGQLATPSLEQAKSDRVKALAGETLDPKKPTSGAGKDAQNAIVKDQQGFAERSASTLSIIPTYIGKLISLPSMGMNWLLEYAAGTQAPEKTNAGLSAGEIALKAEINRPFSMIGILDYMLLFFNGPSYAAKNKANERAALEAGYKQATDALAAAEKQTGLKIAADSQTSTDPTGIKKFALTDGREVEYDPKNPAETKVAGEKIKAEEILKYKTLGDSKIRADDANSNRAAANQRDAAQNVQAEAVKVAEDKSTGGTPATEDKGLTKESLTAASQAKDMTELEKALSSSKLPILTFNQIGLSGGEYYGQLSDGTTFYRKKGMGLDTTYILQGQKVTDSGTQIAIDYLIGKSPATANRPTVPTTPPKADTPSDGAVNYLQAPSPAPETNVPAPTSFLGRVDKISSTKIDNSQYYGSLYYFPLRRATEQSKATYMDAIGEWWKAQGGFGGYLLSQFKSMGKSLLIGYLMDKILAPYGGKNFSKLSTQYWIKRGVCYALIGFYTGMTAKQICDNSDMLVPILTCSVQTYVQGSVMSNNACVPVGAQGMAGVQAGYQNCEKCQADSFPCTAERCQALSSDSSCVYDPYSRLCTPDPEKIKACDNTQNADLKIIEMNNTAIPSNNVFVINDIPYENLQQDIRIRTSLTSECRYTTNKTEGWANMNPLAKDGTLKFHNATIDMSDFKRQNFTTFFLCQDACRKQEFSPIAELRLEKRVKPDLVGPVVISKFPATDLPVEGGDSGRKDITISVETDEDAECKYKEWPLAEGVDSFVGDISNIEKIASDLLNAGTSEQVLDSELSLTGLSYNDTNMTLVGTLGNFSKKHEVKFSGTTGPTKALANDKIYAYVFLCKDTKGNLGEVPGVVRFKVSDPFSVTISGPEDTTVETKPVIEATTDKDSSCRYSLENKGLYSNMTSFDTSGGKDHETTINRLLAYGTHRVFVTCLDADGFNIASADKTFSVTRDTTSPRIVRAYKDADTLLIATNELTSCQYSFKTFAYGKGSDMTGNDPVGNDHRAEWRPETTYFLSCRDRFGNIYGTSLKTTQEATSVLI